MAGQVRGKRTVVVALRMPRDEKAEMLKLCRENGFLNISELLRAAYREARKRMEGQPPSRRAPLRKAKAAPADV